ncbi:sugar ABC transporter permease [Phytohabitans sp. ZYX-F-186]|uniref:Sugar ABC transporter permease n=1 Tax=Phytohabitans maris TaxID=3071409 RepID=A0ABU0ZWC7_9ACTN|nr:sugar ABC transporter permease [Phytohabitans sp. ZYX-F-186]MDQ7911292.1 sugar ABC transporter permease [Phytohabitans sp. ZYX-F-186]
MSVTHPTFLSRGSAGRRQRAGMAFAVPAALVFLLVLAYPVFESFRTSLYNIDLLTGEASFTGLGNYADIIRDESLRRTIRNTLLWTVGSLAGQLLLGLGAALLIDADWRGMRWIRQLLLIPYVVPVIATALVWQWMLDGQYGVLGHTLQSVGVVPEGSTPLGLEGSSLWTVIIVNIWRGFPFAMLVYWARMQSIDREQYEAARVDGAGAWHEFRHITLPNLRSATIALLALRGIWTLMYFELVWLLSRGGPAGSSEVLSTHIYKLVMGEFRIGYAAAIATAAGLLTAAIGTVGWLAVRTASRRHSRA